MKISLYKWFGTYMDTCKSVIFNVLTFIFLWKHKKDLLSKLFVTYFKSIQSQEIQLIQKTFYTQSEHQWVLFLTCILEFSVQIMYVITSKKGKEPLGNPVVDCGTVLSTNTTFMSGLFGYRPRKTEKKKVAHLLEISKQDKAEKLVLNFPLAQIRKYAFCW